MAFSPAYSPAFSKRIVEDWPSVWCPDSIPSDGSRDTAADILSWAGGVPDFHTLRFRDDARYHVELGLRFTGRNLRINGSGDGSMDRGALFYVTAPGCDPHSTTQRSGRRVFYGYNCPDISFIGLRARGVNYFGPGGWLSAPSIAGPGFGEYYAAVEFEHSFAFSGSGRGLVQDCSSYGMFGDCAYWAGCRNMTVRNLLGDSNGRQGIAFNDSQDMEIDGFTLLHGRRSGIDAENNVTTQIIRRLKIHHYTGLTRLLAFTSGGPGDCSDVEYWDNLIQGSGDPVVYNGSPSQGRTVHRTNWNIHDNRYLDLRQGPSAGFQFFLSNAIQVRNNEVPFQVGSPIVHLWSCDGPIAITGNHAYRATGAYSSDVPVTVDEDPPNIYTQAPARPRLAMPRDKQIERELEEEMYASGRYALEAQIDAA